MFFWSDDGSESLNQKRKKANHTFCLRWIAGFTVTSLINGSNVRWLQWKKKKTKWSYSFFLAMTIPFSLELPCGLFFISVLRKAGRRDVGYLFAQMGNRCNLVELKCIRYWSVGERWRNPRPIFSGFLVPPVTLIVLKVNIIIIKARLR